MTYTGWLGEIDSGDLDTWPIGDNPKIAVLKEGSEIRFTIKSKDPKAAYNYCYDGVIYDDYYKYGMDDSGGGMIYFGGEEGWWCPIFVFGNADKTTSYKASSMFPADNRALFGRKTGNNQYAYKAQNGLLAYGFHAIDSDSAYPVGSYMLGAALTVNDAQIDELKTSGTMTFYPGTEYEYSEVFEGVAELFGAEAQPKPTEPTIRFDSGTGNDEGVTYQYSISNRTGATVDAYYALISYRQEYNGPSGGVTASGASNKSETRHGVLRWKQKRKKERKMKKRVLSLLLALTLCIGLAVPAFAADETIPLPTGCSTYGQHYFHSGLVPVNLEGGGWVYVNTKGQIVDFGKGNYMYVFDFSEGYAPFITKDFKLGYIDAAGKVVVPAQFDFCDNMGVVYAGRVIGGNALVFNSSAGDWEQINMSGKKVSRTLNSESENVIYSDIVGNTDGVLVEETEEWGEIGFSEGYALTFEGIVKKKGNQQSVQSDSASDWAKAEIEAARAANLVPELTGNPGYRDAITREQFAELIAHTANVICGGDLYDELKVQQVHFSDCDNEAVREAASIGVISGVGNGKFAPKQTTNREQIATMIARAIAYIKAETGVDLAPSSANISKYTDKAQVSEWAVDGVGLLAANGIMTGTSATTLSPKASCTVEQSILLLYRLYQRTVK